MQLDFSRGFFNSFWFIFILAFSVIHGSAFTFADTYDHMANVDVQTYVGLSNFDFDQNPVRKYRVIIPFLASGLRTLLGPVFKAMTPNNFPGDFSTIMSFMLVNSIFMSFFGYLVFRICQKVIGKKVIIAPLIGMLLILTCRWTPYLSGSALVDSLYLVTMALLLYGILKEEISIVIVSLYLGPWAKESFIFFVPLLAFLPKSTYTKLILHLILSGVIVFGYRYLYDSFAGAELSEGITRDFNHFYDIPKSLNKLFSFHGIYELLSIGGPWWILIILGMFVERIRKYVFSHTTIIWIVFLSSVFIQALLSTELARMFYMGGVFLSVIIALTVHKMLDYNQLSANK